MLKSEVPARYSCQVQEMMKLLGKKWSLLILKCISKNKIISFTELKKELKISQKILWQRLEELEEEGLITNSTCSEIKNNSNISQKSQFREYRSLYQLTFKGVEIEKFLTLFEEIKKE